MADAVGTPLLMESVTKLLVDDDPGLREQACGILGKHPDRRAVPALIKVLKDPVAKVRAAASAALRSIQVYFEQQTYWKRWLEGSTLSSASAAEALLKQARSTSGKKIRLAAIASLGTLGEAQTLPLLIEMMADKDPRIAEAAQKAIQKINSKQGNRE